LLSQGVPMLLAGDELGNGQEGNNNAYCRDDAIGWIDWPDMNTDADADALLRFVRRLITIRRTHRCLRRSHFLAGRPIDGALKDVTWLAPEGREKTESDWNYPDARCLSFMLAGDDSPDGEDGAGDPLLVVLNAHHEAMSYILPSAASVRAWRVVLDTTTATGARMDHELIAATRLTVEPRSVIVLKGHRDVPQLVAPS
jgi:glycogen operon protein